MTSTTAKYRQTQSLTRGEHFGTRLVPLMRGDDQVGTITLTQPHFIDYLGSLDGKFVVHGQITEDGIRWDDERDSW